MRSAQGSPSLDQAPTALFVSTQHWRSCFQLGSHHIARCFADQGWKVGFISAPVSVPHLLGLGGDAARRVAAWRDGGVIDQASSIWHYVPFAPLPWGAAPVFRNRHVVNLAWALSRPGLTRALGQAGFLYPRLAYTDHFLHEGLLRAARPRMTVFRRADNLAAFPGAGRDFKARELAFARRCDLMICTTPSATAHFKEQGIAHTLTVPNGLQLDRFFGDAPLPDEYRGEQRPIVVYVGAAEQWLDMDLIVRGVTELRDCCWTIIGPFDGDTARRLSQAGARVLGQRPHDSLAGYLRHAHVGIVPFSLTRYPDLIAGISPLKVFEYAACGLPVVATQGCQYPRNLPTPLTVCDTAHGFLAAVGAAARQPKPPRPAPARFAAYGWSARLGPLFQWLEQQDEPTRS